MQIIFFVIMFIIGACTGSFLCCQARRMHAKALGLKKLGPRSVCLNCKHQLKWYENIPIISWLVLRGKCKKCGKKIGFLEIFSEIASGITMVLIATTINIATAGVQEWFIFVSLFLLTSTLLFLALYDGAYGELPVACLIAAAVFAAIYVVLSVAEARFAMGGAILSCIILGGLYLALYGLSKGKWVGDGDWILAGIIGLALGQPFYALVALFISNFSACIIMWPYVHKTKNHKIYFGPFLVFGFVLTLIISNYVIINI